MTESEAVDILHMDAADAKNAAVVGERFDTLFGKNDPDKGGSFYLQSKIFRAHEALMADLDYAAAHPEVYEAWSMTGHGAGICN